MLFAQLVFCRKRSTNSRITKEIHEFDLIHGDGAAEHAVKDVGVSVDLLMHHESSQNKDIELCGQGHMGEFRHFKAA